MTVFSSCRNEVKTSRLEQIASVAEMLCNLANESINRDSIFSGIPLESLFRLGFFTSYRSLFCSLSFCLKLIFLIFVVPTSASHLQKTFMWLSRKLSVLVGNVFQWRDKISWRITILRNITLLRYQAMHLILNFLLNDFYQRNYCWFGFASFSLPEFQSTTCLSLLSQSGHSLFCQVEFCIEVSSIVFNSGNNDWKWPAIVFWTFR